MTLSYIKNGFGLGNMRTIEYKSDGKPLETGNIPDYPVSDVEDVEQFSINPDKLSLLNTPVHSDLRFIYGDIDFYIDTVLFEISQTKNIVTTTIPGRNGTVKEYISDGDYVVTIRMAIINQTKSYPEDRVRLLRQLLSLPFAIDVVSPLLQLFEIHSLVISDYRLPPQNGFINTQLVEINCISDQPIELIEDDQTNQ